MTRYGIYCGSCIVPVLWDGSQYIVTNEDPIPFSDRRIEPGQRVCFETNDSGMVKRVLGAGQYS